MKIPGKFSVHGIRAKLSSCFILLLFGVMVILNIVVFQIYKGDIEDKEMAFLEDGNTILVENIKKQISGIESNLTSEIGRSEVFEYLKDTGEVLEASVVRKLRSFGTLMHFQGLECECILAFDRDGQSFFCDYQETGLTLETVSGMEVYQAISEQRETMFPAKGCTIWRSYADDPGKVYVIKSYINPTSLKYEGIICLRIDSSYLNQLLGEYSFNNVIYDEQGGFLYCNLEDSGQPDWENTEQYLNSVTSIRWRGREWKLAAFLAKSEAFGDLWVLMRLLLLGELLLLLIVLAVVHKITESFLWNVTALAKTFHQIDETGEMQEIHPRSHDETTYLCHQFEEMYHQIRESAEKMALTETLLDQAEYNALLAQMNPHFIYNSLDSISAMAKLAGQEEIVRVIRMLSHLMRGAIGGGEQEIPLRRELEYISCYLEMQQMITGGKLVWDIEVEEEMMECPVPRLILQPIVENAIIHGLDEMLSDAVIILTAAQKEDMLILTVSDNGKGASQEALDALLRAEDADIPEHDHTHIGVRSIQKRIHILYGDAYGISMQSEPENGMVVRLSLPYRRKKE